MICLTRLGVYLELFFENGCIFGICKKLGVFLELQKVLGVYLEFSHKSINLNILYYIIFKNKNKFINKYYFNFFKKYFNYILNFLNK